MNNQILIWTVIAVVSAIVIAVRIISSVHKNRRVFGRFIESGPEWEEFFVAGDRLFKGDYDYDEFDGE